jgi:molybdopterin/thiamine biosynthesis adenylyltransferase
MSGDEPDAASLPDREFHLALTEGVHEDLREVLYPEEGHPHAQLGERGAIGIITESTGVERTTYLLQRIIRPDPGLAVGDDGTPEDIYVEGTGFDQRLWFSRDYRTRVTDAAAGIDGGGLIYLHTHPFGGVTPSTSDMDQAAEDYRLHQQHLDGPFAKGIVACTDPSEDDRDGPQLTGEEPLQWGVRAYEPGVDCPEITHATAVRVVGQELQKRPTPEAADGPAGAGGESRRTTQDSVEQLWGKAGQETLAGLRVGLVGCGGVGSILAEHLARLGVGELVTVDFDVIEKANLNRAQGATEADARLNRPKVEVASEVALESATAPNFDVRPIEGSVVEQDEEYRAVDDLLDCDIIVNAADSAWARCVLDDVAYAHLIPVLNGGTILRMDGDGTLSASGKSEVTVSGPSHPCMECSHVYSNEDVSEEMEREGAPERGNYLEGADEEADQPRAPSVIGANATVAGMMQLRFMGVSLGVTEDTTGVQRYLPRTGRARWSPTDGCKDGCSRSSGLPEGDTVSLPLGEDTTLRAQL